MTFLGKTTLAAALAFTALGTTAAFAGNGIMDRIGLQLRDGSCEDQAVQLLADETLTLDQVRDRLRDCSCVVDDPDQLQLQTQTRTRTGADNGSDTAERTRTEGGRS